MRLPDLPVEIQLAILARLDKLSRNNDEGKYTMNTGDLRNVRLVCRALLPAATRQLFSKLRLLPDEKSVEKMDKILAHAELRAFVQELMIETIPEENWELVHSYLVRSKDFKFQEEWWEALSRLPEFPYVTSVFLSFSADYNANAGLLGGVWHLAASPQGRLDILVRVFKALADINGREGRRIRRLSIKNLQNVVHDKLVMSDQFKAVVSALEELHISVLTEHTNRQPIQSVYEAAVYEFWPAFSQKWLGLAAPQLTALTLYCSTPWGTVPKWDLEELHFPQLRSLALRNYVFTYDWQIDWILKHSTLESLWFEDCPIVNCYLFRPGELQPDTGRLVRLPLQMHQEQLLMQRVETDICWHTIFERLRDGLPRLADFRITGCYRWDNRYAFETRHLNHIHLDRRRYTIFDAGNRPSYWTAPRSTWIREKELGDRGIDRRDAEALKNLVMTVRARGGLS